MPGNLFGYEPPMLPSYVAQYYDYVGTVEVDYDATNWDNKSEINIETLWEAIEADSDEETEGLVEMWRRLSVLLESTRSNIEQYAVSLQQAWGGPAAEQFLRRIGGALYSLDQWQATADTNSRAMERVASKIESTQSTMKGIWDRYIPDLEQAQSTYQAREDDNALQQFGNWIGDGIGDAPEKPDEVRDRYTNEAKGPMRELATAYLDESFALDRGSTYAGPTTARQPVMPTMPGGPGGPGGAPAIPTAPTMPNLPFPDLPPRPEFNAELVGIVAPPMPNLPTVPPGPPGLPPGVPPGGLPPLPGMPFPPGMPPGGGPRPPSLPRPPGRPGMPGTPPVPPRPTLPGTSGRTGMPGQPGSTAPPGAPRRPNLSGTSPRGTAPARPTMPGLPGGGTSPTAPPSRATPPRLTGARTAPPGGGVGQPGGPGAPGGRGGVPRTPGVGRPPGSSLPPQLAGRRQPGEGAPVDRRVVRRGAPGSLGGRATPPAGGGPGGGASGGGPRPQLGGRRQPGQSGSGFGGVPTRRKGKSAEEKLHRTDLISDEDLWGVDQAPPEVVDTPEPPPPPTPGTAIGRPS